MEDANAKPKVEWELRAAQRRAERLTLPAVVLSEWCQLHSVTLDTARGWAQRGEYPAGAVWQSGRDWLIRPTEPVPQPKVSLNGKK